MTLQNPKLLLLIAMVGLYLYDSALLLASNEALLSRGWRGRWHGLFGAGNFPIRGKEPLLPNPLLPHRPLYRYAWETTGFVGPAQPWSAPHRQYAVLAPFIWNMALALFVLVPLGLFSRLGQLAIAAAVILFYANALLALAFVWFKRAAFSLSSRRFGSLAFESLTCPPFALNLIRHLSLELAPAEDFLFAATRLLDAQERGATIAQMIKRVRHEIDWEQEDGTQAAALHAHLKYLDQENTTCRAPNS